MTTPTLSTVARHFDTHGGLWLVVPRRTDKGQPRPLFALLGVAQGLLGPFITYEGGDFELPSTITRLYRVPNGRLLTRGNRI